MSLTIKQPARPMLANPDELCPHCNQQAQFAYLDMNTKKRHVICLPCQALVCNGFLSMCRSVGKAPRRKQYGA